MRIKIAGILAFVFFVGQHLQLMSLFGFPVTLGAGCGIALLILVSRPRGFTGVIGVSCAVITVSSTAAMFSSADADLVQYVRTLTLFVLAFSVVALGWSGTDLEFLKSNAFHRAVLLALFLIVTLSVGQVILGAMGSLVLFNPFGSFQYLYQYNPHLEFVQFPRAQGFYLEPSYDAFVICALSVILFCLNKSRKLAAVLVTLGLLACQSASGLLLLALALIFVVFRARPATGAVSVLILALVGGLAGPYLLVRLSTLDETGTSANYRIVAPLDVLSDVLLNTPLGEPLGSIATVLERYGLQNGSTQGTSLDNGFYVLIFYFGWIGLVALVAFVIAMLVLSIRRARIDRGISWIAPIWLAGSFLFSGGIMLPEFALMTWFVVVAFNYFEPAKGARVVQEPREASALSRHDYLQRPSWSRQNP
ncbi:putative colanic acid polymerase WcaD [Arthrobacter oryzae]|uniref:putative colanic acid polymerase WcaD n=1 Tax=Arthrobacter oryzae TaxID=409290 RepID=UPI0027810E89|nr:putative colanic acid polymerase WcaD [Arthrobacter oryzae]MDQ0078477.1 putative colanic acid polymerase [Arthrobacter oryzae]